MMKILIGQTKDRNCEILEQNLEYEIKGKLLCLPTEDDFLSWVKMDHKADLIILHEKEIDITNLLPIFQKLSTTPQIHLYTDTPDLYFGKNIKTFPESDYQVESLIPQSINALSANHDDNILNDVPDYVPFSIHYFHNISSFISDIYIKLKKNGVEQFVKRINADDEIDSATLEKYQNSGLEFFYIKKEFRFHFMNQAVSETIDGLKSAYASELKQLDSQEPQEKSILNIGDESYKLNAEMLLDVGITENTIKLTKASIVSMKKNLNNLDSIAPLLERLLKEKLSYPYKRAHLISMFGLEVLKRVDWFSGEQRPQLYEQMVYASFLHDILLSDEKLLRVHSKLDLYKANLDERQKKLVLNHANMTSTLIQRYPKAPSHVDVMIKQHHGTTNGVGFSENLNASLPKMIIILMVCEKFVIRLLDFDKNEDKLTQILADLEAEFHLPTYKKVTDCLKDTLLNAAKKSQ